MQLDSSPRSSRSWLLWSSVALLLAACVASRPAETEVPVKEVPESEALVATVDPSGGTDAELDSDESSLLEEVREPTEAELDALGFKLTGNLRDVAGRVPPGRIRFALTQFPGRIFSNHTSVERGSFECDETGAFVVRVPGYRPVESKPMLVRLSPSRALLRGYVRFEPFTADDCVEYFQELYEGERMERSSPSSLSLNLGELQLRELPVVTEVWLNSGEPSELECGVENLRWGFLNVNGTVTPSDTGYTLRAGEVLTLYSEFEGQDIQITLDSDSGWAVRESVLPVGSRQALTVFPTSTTTLNVRKEDHPDGEWWELLAADDYPPPPVIPTEKWSWETLLWFRTWSWGEEVGTSQVFSNLFPQTYKVLIWSKEPTEDGLPIRVIDLELGGEDRRVRVR